MPADPNSDYDRAREDALREEAYLEAERAEAEADELGVELPYWRPTETDLTDIPF